MNRELRENERIVRCISPRYMGESGVSARAFCLRQDRPEEKGLSVNWLGVLGVGERRQPAEIRRIFGTKFEIRRSGRFAEMRVGDVLRRVCENEQGWSAAAAHYVLPFFGSHISSGKWPVGFALPFAYSVAFASRLAPIRACGAHALSNPTVPHGSTPPASASDRPSAGSIRAFAEAAGPSANMSGSG